MSTINKFIAISSIVSFKSMEEWSEQVAELNKENKLFIAEDDLRIVLFSCYVCGNDFAHGSHSLNVTFRYKPHKPDWSQEQVCVACFHALQNPAFADVFADDAYGYPGILTEYKDGSGWFYKDTCDLSDLPWKYQNPDSDPKTTQYAPDSPY
jgi:hypothetical protein